MCTFVYVRVNLWIHLRHCHIICIMQSYNSMVSSRQDWHQIKMFHKLGSEFNLHCPNKLCKQATVFRFEQHVCIFVYINIHHSECVLYPWRIKGDRFTCLLQSVYVYMFVFVIGTLFYSPSKLFPWVMWQSPGFMFNSNNIINNNKDIFGN